MPRQVSRRASLPGASELFRPTEAAPVPVPEPAPESSAGPGRRRLPDRGPGEPPAATGRVRHDQKITVYFSSEELFALEDATLELRRTHGVNLDRGRLVRTAVALALADLAEHGGESVVVGELRSQ